MHNFSVLWCDSYHYYNDYFRKTGQGFLSVPAQCNLPVISKLFLNTKLSIIVT